MGVIAKPPYLLLEAVLLALIALPWLSNCCWLLSAACTPNAFSRDPSGERGLGLGVSYAARCKECTFTLPMPQCAHKQDHCYVSERIAVSLLGRRSMRIYSCLELLLM